MRRYAQNVKPEKHYQNLPSAEPEKTAMIHGVKNAETRPRETEILQIPPGQVGNQKPPIRDVN